MPLPLARRRTHLWVFTKFALVVPVPPYIARAVLIQSEQAGVEWNKGAAGRAAAAQCGAVAGCCCAAGLAAALRAEGLLLQQLLYSRLDLWSGRHAVGHAQWMAGMRLVRGRCYHLTTMWLLLCRPVRRRALSRSMQAAAGHSCGHIPVLPGCCPKPEVSAAAPSRSSTGGGCLHNSTRGAAASPGVP